MKKTKPDMQVETLRDRISALSKQAVDLANDIERADCVGATALLMAAGVISGYATVLEKNGAPVMGIGSPIWRFDENRRKYVNGRVVWREHWQKLVVVDENRVSWGCGFSLNGCAAYKAPKKRATRQLREWAFSEAEVDDMEWLHEHRYAVLQLAQHDVTPAQVRAIANMIGYKPRGD